MSSSTMITVCISTHNRPDTVGRAIESVLAQPDPVAVVVVNNGTPHIAEAITREFGGRGVRVISTEDLGLCSSRNDGAAIADTEWLAFLDDDDALLAEWSSIMLENVTAGVGLISCSARFETVSGETVREDHATELVPLVGSVRGVHLAGCFAVRTELFVAAGGYLPGLPCSHQSELWIRLTTEATRRGIEVRADRRVGTLITSRDPVERPLSNPRLLLDGCRWLLTRHRAHFEQLPKDRANLAGMAGVNAARVGEWGLARSYSLDATFTQPTSPKRWARLGLSLAPFAARHIWTGAEAFDGSVVARNGLELVRDAAAGDLDRRDDLLFLPWGYETNPSLSADADGNAFWKEGTAANDIRWQDPVYRWAARRIRSKASRPPVIDIGCGSGHKLVARVGAVTPDIIGVDQESGIAIARRAFPSATWISGDLGGDAPWAEAAELNPRLVICSDVIEHVEDPYALLARIKDLVGDDGEALISTPDRGRLERVSHLGPPHNVRHIREWRWDEFHLLLEAAGFRVRRARRLLPRSYSPTLLEAKRMTYRALHHKALPDRRTSMAFLVRAKR